MRRKTVKAVRLTGQHAAYALQMLIEDGKIASRDVMAALKRREKTVRELRARLSALGEDVSEAVVGLSYSALLLRDQGLAAQVSQLEDRLDEMREQLELWVLRAAAETIDPSGLRGLLHLGAASEEVGDAAIWPRARR